MSKVTMIGTINCQDGKGDEMAAVLATMVGDSGHVIKRIHRVVAACQQVLEVLPGCIKVFEAKIDDCHEPQRIGAPLAGGGLRISWRTLGH